MSQHSPAPAGSPSALGEIIARLADNISGIISGEIALAKAQAKRLAKEGGLGAGLLAAAGLLALYALGYLFTSIIEALALALPMWASYLIVSVVLFIIVAILALLGKNALERAQADVPNPQVRLQADAQAFKGAFVSSLSPAAPEAEAVSEPAVSAAATVAAEQAPVPTVDSEKGEH